MLQGYRFQAKNGTIHQKKLTASIFQWSEIEYEI